MADEIKLQLISPSVFLTVSLFMEQIRIGIRKFKDYGTGRLYPTKVGVSLSLKEFEDLQSYIPQFIADLTKRNATLSGRRETPTVYEFNFWTAIYEKIGEGEHGLKIIKYENQSICLSVNDLVKLGDLQNEINQSIEEHKQPLPSTSPQPIGLVKRDLSVSLSVDGLSTSESELIDATDNQINKKHFKTTKFDRYGKKADTKSYNELGGKRNSLRNKKTSKKIKLNY